MASLEDWACAELDRLGIPDAGDIVRYLQPIENPAEVEEYLVSMLDRGQASHQKFIKEFLKKQDDAKSAMDSRFYRKTNVEEDLGYKISDGKKKQKNKENGGGNGGKSQSDSSGNSNKSSYIMSSSAAAAKKKTKFVSLYTDEGQTRDVILLTGRHKCNCQASKHRLINNCLKCGRIICEQEGSGPCPFCGNLVTTREQKEILNRGSRKSEALQKKLLSEKNAVVKTKSKNAAAKDKASGSGQSSDHLQKAIEHKNLLLEFDRTSEKRTKVYDDENDYFCINSKWISHEDKVKLTNREEELRKKRFDRSNQKITIDLFGRKIVAEEAYAGVYDPDDPLVKEILEGKTHDIFSAPDRKESGPKIEVSRPEYTVTDAARKKKNIGSKFSAGGSKMRVQDRELLEMTDEGMCLSMHQPWASLLIEGIKIHEGRMWYSSHRGRLWIAAAAKTPTPEEISQLEDMYRVLLKDKNLPFPQHYPSGCLLGCVDVVDVLPQEEYRAKFPEGESDSPYVFVCENPQEMILKFPMKGEHKIYKLDSKIHQAAKKALRAREE